MRYWDMKLIVDTDDGADPFYQKFNGMIWSDSFQHGVETKTQKRDRLINQVLKQT